MADAHDIQSWLNGDKLRSRKIREQYPLIGLIVGLVFLYILIGYQSAKQQHRLTDTKKEKVMSKQICRSGTSIGANVAESKFAQSRADFISKLSIALS
jgi:hypothetical protein